MTQNHLIEYLQNSEILQTVRDLLRNFCELELVLLDPNGQPLQLDNLKFQELNLPHYRFAKGHCKEIDCHIQSGCGLRSPEFFEQLGNAREARSIVCEKGHRNIFVPVTVDDQTIAFLYIASKDSLSLTVQQTTVISSFLKKITGSIINHELKFFHEFKGNGQSRCQKVLKKVLQDIQENYHLPELSLVEVSRRNGMSYHYLSRMFKKELKTTFSKYRNKIRMDVASKLLKDKSLSVSEVSYACGFEDPGYFCKVFKGAFGFSPVDFRDKNVVCLRRAKETANC